MRIRKGLKGIRKFISDNGANWHVWVQYPTDVPGMPTYEGFFGFDLETVMMKFDHLEFTGWTGNGLFFAPITLTPAEIAKQHASLARKAQSAYNTYSRAAGSRKNTGKRIQSMAEVRAHGRYREACNTLRNFEQEHSLPMASLNY